MKALITVLTMILGTLTLNAASMSWSAVHIVLRCDGHLDLTISDPEGKLANGAKLYLYEPDAPLEDIFAEHATLDDPRIYMLSETEITDGKVNDAYFDPFYYSDETGYSLGPNAFLILTADNDYMAGYLAAIPGIETIFVPEYDDEEAGIYSYPGLYATGTLIFRPNTVLTDNIPEPSSGLLMLIGSGLLALRRKFR